MTGKPLSLRAAFWEKGLQSRKGLKGQVAMAELLTECAVGHCASFSFLETTFKMVKRRAKAGDTSLLIPALERQR